MAGFRSLPVFRPGLVGVHTRGADAVRLSGALAGVPDAYPAAVALGDPSIPARRARALRILEGLPARQRERILAAYERTGQRA
ncbi:hypothetical protein [Methylobacterium nodulans]|uniref:Uncharacterized protein n=1 Tax=Methylobacterium nodulans (strain LMG 21967 / CNCM I-2342 / ORS 2060) TaxID=460265 RepID=B8IIP7_METNO|nr:hypothetical protein [Methylobacterium nodulans]ACL59924.1 conserved hypothetical protein [Methylobacterium nodulans ORS 2060]